MNFPVITNVCTELQHVAPAGSNFLGTMDNPPHYHLFVALKANGVCLVVVEDATRVAHDLMVAS